MSVRIIVTGLVQGVFFRAQTKEKADELALTGWVRNNNDSSVEIHAEGPEEKLKELEQWCRKGPLGANVLSVQTREEKCEGEFASFEIRR